MDRAQFAGEFNLEKCELISSAGVSADISGIIAEINIFDQVQVEETDTLYVTLEPCFHSDTSPSCATEIINQGVKNIVIGDIDLDIRTNGKSVSLLKDNNISVQIESNVNNIINPYYENTHKKLKDIHYLLKIGMFN